jgi:catechol 2,3-dioxygenase-like lactoylglutathione lyase family enzyme
MDMKLEVVVIPVSDVDRAKDFYTAAGFRLDADFPIDDGYRIVQVTPPGSEASIIFGTGVSSAAPGSSQGIHLIVTDIEAAKAELESKGVEVSDFFRHETGAFHNSDTSKNIAGLDPERRSYGSFASFSDPDGNGWVLQEIVERAPGR